MDERFLLFGLESFNALLNQVLPASLNWETSLVKITGSGFDENKLTNLLSQVVKILADPLETLEDDLKYHMIKQLEDAINKKIVIKSDILGEFKLEFIKEDPKIKISKLTSDDISKLPIVSINKEVILSILEQKSSMLEMILKKKMSLSNTSELSQGFTRILLSIPSLYLTRKELLSTIKQGFLSLLSQFN
ncbi:MAG: hypothetical protein EAX96_13035 [Candidatus Lokiarchaeota archaeon]|nr:hypothetical protein [Candidatus Lokiarchaeota archaeon]